MLPSVVLARGLSCALVGLAVRTELDTGAGRTPNSNPSVATVSVCRVDSNPPRTQRRICRVTAYCDRGLTAAGIPSGVGQCAAPGDIPLGSVVYIPELDRSFVVTDRTHLRFRDNTVDIFIPDRGDCLQFGLNFLECHFTLIDQPPRYGTLRMDGYALAAR